jgi:SPP1 family predicted phage head-tail adaptor
MTYRTGELDQRVSVMRLQSTPDGYGGTTRDWVSAGEYWAHVRPQSGREVADFDRLQGEARYLFVFRNGIDLKDSDRLDWQGEQFNIRVRKQPKMRSLYVEVEAERGVAQ